MKKEVLLAVGLGFALGLVITFGIWTANQSLKKLQTTAPIPTPLPNTTPVVLPTTAPVSSDLVITSPEDEALVNKNSVDFSGKTYANTVVTIISEGDEQMVTSDDKGNFKTTVDLVSGYNVIKAIAYNPDGLETSQTITVTYSTTKI